MANVAAMYMEAEEAEEHDLWAGQLAQAVQNGEDGGYVGFIGDEGEDGARRAYPEPTWSRLADVKRRYDPENLFHRNKNVSPARGSVTG